MNGTGSLPEWIVTLEAAKDWGIPPWIVEEQASAEWIERWAVLRAESNRASRPKQTNAGGKRRRVL
jgi:hypothetical protein